MLRRKPILSFCIPTFNRAERVYRCVLNILEYKYDTIEVVVSNNASQDNTLELLAQINDDRLKVFTNEENIGGLNWPLAVSRANGDWAALMSDEDSVCLDNLQYYIDRLPSLDSNGIGAIVYSFFPVNWIVDEYISSNTIDCVKQVVVYGGHITSHILNMRYFELGVLEDYRGYGFLKDDGQVCVSEPPVSEPQHEILFRNVERSKVMLCPVPLCSFGIDEQYDKTVIKTSPPIWSGQSPFRREILINAYYNKLLKAKRNLNEYCCEYREINFEAVTVVLLSRIVANVARFVRSAITGINPFRPNLYKIIQKELHLKNSDVIPQVIDSLERVVTYFTKLEPNSNIQKYAYYMKCVLEHKFNIPFDDNMPYESRLLLGDFLFVSYNKIFEVTKAVLDENGVPISYETNYSDDLSDDLELRKTDEMLRKLRDEKDYDGVIAMKDICSFRRHYLRGVAYLAKQQYDDAIRELELFLGIVQKPSSLYEILTGLISVQNAYFYLAFSQQKVGKFRESVKNFAKCDELTNKLLLGDRLSPMRQIYAK